MKKVEGGVTAAEGFQAASTAAGIKYKDRTVWQFVNTYLNECYSFQIYTIIDELDDEQLRTIIKHFDL